MSSLDDAILALRRQTAISPAGPAYREIEDGLAELGVVPAFFLFQTADKSGCARKLDGGRHVSCPALTLYLEFDDDFAVTGIDRQAGNWGDEWRHTAAVRNVLNRALRRHRYGDHYVSDHTLVFVRTQESVAFLEIGKRSKSVVAEMMVRAAPGVRVARVYWLETRTFYAIMADKSDYERVKRRVLVDIGQAIPDVLKRADPKGYCRNYQVELQVGYDGMNEIHLIRGDLD